MIIIKLNCSKIHNLFVFFSELDAEEPNAPYDFRNHYETKTDENEVKQRMNDLKNRIELRRMFSEYMAGNLKPPIYYKDGIAAPDYSDQNDDVEAIESIFEQQQPQSKRIVLPSQNNENHHGFDEYENYDEFPLGSLFREHQKPKYVADDDVDDDTFEPQNNDPNEYHRRLFKSNRPRDQAAVYTEGGLVYGPSTHITSTQARKRKCIIDLRGKMN